MPICRLYGAARGPLEDRSASFAKLKGNRVHEAWRSVDRQKTPRTLCQHETDNSPWRTVDRQKTPRTVCQHETDSSPGELSTDSSRGELSVNMKQTALLGNCRQTVLGESCLFESSTPSTHLLRPWRTVDRQKPPRTVWGELSV